MNASFIESEAKKWLRDSMMTFMLMYPLLFGIIGRWIVPWITDAGGFNLDPFMHIVLAALLLMAPHIFGALIGFSILDDRDDHIFTSIQVTPLSIGQFLAFRLSMALVLAFLTCIYIILFSDLLVLTLIEVVLIAVVACLSAPMVGMLINAFAKNKIEGFAMMKGIVAILMIFPVASLFFTDGKEWFFAFTPGFWPAKALSTIVIGEAATLSFYAYIGIGLIYALILNYLVYKLFTRKAL